MHPHIYRANELHGCSLPQHRSFPLKFETSQRLGLVDIAENPIDIVYICHGEPDRSCLPYAFLEYSLHRLSRLSLCF